MAKKDKHQVIRVDFVDATEGGTFKFDISPNQVASKYIVIGGGFAQVTDPSNPKIVYIWPAHRLAGILILEVDNEDTP